MKDIKDIVFVIQARLGSQRVPQKMIKSFCGTNLLDIALDKMSFSKIPSSQFFVSAYEDDLKSICYRKDVNIFHRSKESADSEGTPMSLMYEWWNKLPFKYCVLTCQVGPAGERARWLSAALCRCRCESVALLAPCLRAFVYVCVFGL